MSVHTRRAYAIGIRMLVADWRDEDLLHPSQDAALKWLRHLERAGAWRQDGTVGPATPSTVRVRLAAGRALYRALRWAGATSADPFQDLRAAPEPTPAWEKSRPYSEADVAALFAAANPRDQAIVLLGAHAGLRVAEMCGLYGRDLDPARGRLVVRSEIADRQREVAMSPSLIRTLDRLGWVADRPLLGLTDSGVRKRLLRLCARAGVPYRGAHALRHAAGTRVLRGGGSLRDAARHLGHGNLETARVYARWAATADHEQAED
ncbi:MAG TPA: site-specific integrase [Chloroflexota bacterium]|nr:site-specific integrase [Chloroflexota bacterium]